MRVCRGYAVVGYSFGAWVAYRYARIGGRVDSLILISPPVSLLSPWETLAAPLHAGIICGSTDAFCSPTEANPLSASLSTSMKVVEGADHFWTGREQELGSVLDDLISAGSKPVS